MLSSVERRAPQHEAPGNAWQRLRLLWPREFAVFDEPGAAAAEIRAKQLRTLVRLTPFTLSANLLNGAIAWFALQFGPSTFGVFDTFADEEGRQAHLRGPIAAALMANAAALLSTPPNIEKVDLLAAKLPG